MCVLNRREGRLVHKQNRGDEPGGPEGISPVRGGGQCKVAESGLFFFGWNQLLEFAEKGMYRWDQLLGLEQGGRCTGNVVAKDGRWHAWQTGLPYMCALDTCKSCPNVHDPDMTVYGPQHKPAALTKNECEGVRFPERMGHHGVCAMSRGIQALPF